MVLCKQKGSVLSVNAAPFHPTGFRYDPVEICIYNDGEPTMTLASEKDRYDILHGISDDALDQVFPPDAEEANELETTESFVKEMAMLAMLEEREEHARRTLCHLEKRWEVRRAAGPSGRPRPAMHLIVPVDHSVKVRRPMTTTVALHKVCQRSIDRYERAKMTKRIDHRRIKAKAAPLRPIHQPRKSS
jgi:hypothetical protein